eukprot:7217606-Alexandrium_andersonii.AAC.1
MQEAGGCTSAALPPPRGDGGDGGHKAHRHRGVNLARAAARACLGYKGPLLVLDLVQVTVPLQEPSIVCSGPGAPAVLSILALALTLGATGAIMSLA